MPCVHCLLLFKPFLLHRISIFPHLTHYLLHHWSNGANSDFNSLLGKSNGAAWLTWFFRDSWPCILRNNCHVVQQRSYQTNILIETSMTRLSGLKGLWRFYCVKGTVNVCLFVCLYSMIMPGGLCCNAFRRCFIPLSWFYVSGLCSFICVDTQKCYCVNSSAVLEILSIFLVNKGGFC